ncbi:hypothetical protein [Candidatus Poriferisodalis sp.]|uniref:hypothetical protein n=1 Tax=Candidatus Poriferisodalis sp. TaxID=3101277 RepID=UPI003B017E5E
MNDNNPEFDQFVQTVNNFCAELENGARGGQLSTFCVRRRLELLDEEDSDGESVYHALATACGYDTLLSNSKPDLELACGDFVPSLVDFDTDGMSVFPCPLSRVTERTLRIWRGCAGEDDLHPIVRARLADLLFARDSGDTTRWAWTALFAYLEVSVNPHAPSHERAFALLRAITLCSELREVQLLDKIMEAAVRDIDISEIQAHAKTNRLTCRSFPNGTNRVSDQT